MLVVFSSLVGSLTVLPALLGKLGDRIERGLRQVLAAGVLRLLRLFKARAALAGLAARDADRAAAAEGRPAGVAAVGLRDHPVDAPALARSAALDAALLVVLALPVLGMHTKLLELHRPAEEPERSSRPTTRSRRPSRAPRIPPHLVVKANDVTTPQFAKAYRRVQAARARDRRDPRSRSASPSTRRRRSRGSTSRSPAKGRTQRLMRALATLRTR